MLEKANWIGRKAGEIQPMTGHPLENIEHKKNEIEVPSASLLLRTVFVLKKPAAKVSVSICGLGLYTLKINGQRVGDAVLTPLQTNYRKMALYDVLDITKHLLPKDNVLVAELGTGQYAPPPKRWDWRMCWYGNVRAAISIEIQYKDGTTETIVSDERFKMQDGPVMESCIYDGETYDARKVDRGIHEAAYDDSQWENAKIVECPAEQLVENVFPPIKVCGTYEPCTVKNTKHGWLYDFGKNRAGRMRISVSGKPGDILTIRHCERLGAGGEADFTTNNGAAATDTYILNGGGVEDYAPEFTYHGFRYALLISSADSVRIHSAVQEHIHSDVAVAGEFLCDNAQINKIHDACCLTMRNCFVGFPIDCPQRDERMGWLGDAHVIAESGLYNFDLLEFYRKWLMDIKLDCAETGEVPHIAPWPQRREPSPADWSVGYLIIALAVYKMYGDKTIIEAHYDSFKKYMEYLYSISDEFILPKGRYGDWSSSLADFQRGDPQYDNTMFYYYALSITRQCAEILEIPEDMAVYDDLLCRMRKRCMDLYYNADEKCFGTGEQFSNAFALMLGLVPEADMQAVLAHIIKDIADHDGHLIGGIFGVQYVMEQLRRFDRGDIAVDIMLKKDYPSWLDMLSRNTTLTECWRGDKGSLDHCMLGSVDAQLYKLLGGLEIDRSKKPWVKIMPYVTDRCGWVHVSKKTAFGEIVSEWRNHADAIEYYIEIPKGIQGEFAVSGLNRTAHMELNGDEFSGTALLNSGFHTVIVHKNR